MRPKFLYFDLGNVLLNFSHERMCQQMAAALEVEPAAVYEVLFEGPRLLFDFETGRLSSEEMYGRLCEHFGRRPSLEKLATASADIFELNYSILPVITHLAHRRVPMGILSNTSIWHWHFITTRPYAIVNELFRPHLLSFEVGAMKPDPTIFRVAAERAGVRPEEIFYTDDVAGHVEAACAAGFDAVQYTSTPALVEALLARELPLRI